MSFTKAVKLNKNTNLSKQQKTLDLKMQWPYRSYNELEEKKNLKKSESSTTTGNIVLHKQTLTLRRA